MNIQKTLTSALAAMLLSGAAFAAEEGSEELLFTVHTNLYAENGEDNLFSMALGATQEGTAVSIDCGFGLQEMTVGVAQLNDSTIEGSLFTGAVSADGLVRVYGDPSTIDYVNASGCAITSIEFNPNLALQILNLEYNELESLDIDALENLAVIYLKDNEFSEDSPLNIGYLPNVQILEIAQIGHVSPSFDLKNFPALVSFDAYHVPTLKTVDPTQCPNLVRLSLDMTSVASVDVTRNAKLQILNVSNSRVTNIDLSQNPVLQEFYCNHSSGRLNTDVKMQSLDVTHNPQLYYLFCAGNGLASIDLTHNPILFDLSAPDNNFTSIDLSKNTNLYDVNLRGNKLDFATLPFDPGTWSEYYYDQQDMELNDSYGVGDRIDLSKRVLREGTVTTAKLYYIEREAPTDAIELDSTYYTYDNGVITLLKAFDKQVFIGFSNNVLSAYDLHTELFRIRSAEEFGKPIKAFEFASNTPTGYTISLSLGIVGASAEHPVEAYVDFGDGEQQTFSITTEETPADPNVSGKRLGYGNIQVYLPQNEYLSALATEGLNLTRIDLTQLDYLRFLSLRNADLYSIDLSYNNHLERLDLTGNQLSSITLQGPNYYFYKGSLSDINLSNNKLTSLTVDDFYAVKRLNLSNNQLSTLDVSDADSLHVVDLSDNLFESLTFTNSEAIDTLNVSGNYLISLTVPDESPLASCDISSNKFTFASIVDESLLGGRALNAKYAPQRPITIATSSPSVDLSAQDFNINGYHTQYAWYYEDGTPLVEGTDYTLKSGITRFQGNLSGKVYCSMTHKALPAFAGEDALRTTLTTPISAPQYKIASFTTPEGGEEVELSLAAEKEGTSVYFDWQGTGELSQYILTTTYTRFDAMTYSGVNVGVYVANEDDQISVFSITGATMADLDVSALDKASAITIGDAGISSFNLKESKKLTELNLGGNNLTELDITGFPNLYYISLNGNELTSFDLGQVPGLGLAYLGNNQLTSVTFNNDNLWNLDLSCNQLESVSFDGAENIEQLWLNANKLSTVDVSSLSRLNVLNLVDNCFTFATLPLPKSSWYSYSYGLQQPIEAEVDGNVVDLSAQALVDTTKTAYRWFVGSVEQDEDGNLVGNELTEGVDFTLENGITTFSLEESTDNLVCIMTNDVFPNLIQYTNYLSVTVGIEEVKEDAKKTAFCYDLMGRRIMEGHCPTAGSVWLHHQLKWKITFNK